MIREIRTVFRILDFDLIKKFREILLLLQNSQEKNQKAKLNLRILEF